MPGAPLVQRPSPRGTVHVDVPRRKSMHRSGAMRVHLLRRSLLLRGCGVPGGSVVWLPRTRRHLLVETYADPNPNGHTDPTDHTDSGPERRIMPVRRPGD